MIEYDNSFWEFHNKTGNNTIWKDTYVSRWNREKAKDFDEILEKSKWMKK